MICPKCKTELPDDTIRCPNCGIRLNVICPECKTVNTFGTLNCRNCSRELIKICPVCKSYNLPNAKVCRKCSNEFDTNENKTTDDIDIVKPFSNKVSNYNVSEIFNDSAKIKNEEDSEDTPEKIFNIESEFDKEEAQEQEQSDDFLPDRTPESVLESDKLSEEEKNREDEILNIDNVEDLIVDVNDSLESENKESESEFQSKVEPIEEEVSDENEILPEIVKNTVTIIKNSISKHIIAVNGDEGCGKSAVLKQAVNSLNDSGYICLYGSLTPLLQITSFGFFQDAFLRIMGFPPFIKSSEAFIRDFKKSKFAKIFSCLDSKELSLFLNIFYPHKKDSFENILENKKVIFSIIEKVISSLLVNNNIVIAIDNFELLDGASYDFIVYLIQKGYFNNRLKLLAAYQEKKSIQSYFDLTEIDESIFETILINKFDKEGLIKAVAKSCGTDIEKLLDSDLIDELISKSNGNAIRMEQEAAFLFDINYITLEDDNIVVKQENKPDINPETFEELIKLRLNVISPITKNLLFMAAAMGFRFSTAILFLALDIQQEKAQNMLDFLVKELYINYVDNFTCEFKSLTLWKIIYKEAKADSLYKDNSKRLYSVLESLILSSNLQKLISCADALNKNEEFEIWQDTLKLTSQLGDTNLYVIAQKQCLKLLDEITIENPEEIRARIYEETGKLLCEKSPKEAETYIANVLDNYIKDGNVKKVIDLSGYFIKSCYLTGNYFGVSEAVDAVIAAISGCDVSISSLEISLIKTRKLPALLNIGNSEQIINLVKEEILIDIEKALNSEQTDVQYHNLIIHAALNCMVILAKAYAIQGNREIFNVIEQLREFIAKYNYNIEYYSTQTNILEAFGHTITGDINKSGEVLNNILVQYKNKKMDTELLAQWNLINVINRVLLGETEDLKSDLFELAAFTNNINEHSIKNIVKLILGYILKEEGNKTKALEIFNEEITYFAKEKVAIGAMLSWALIVEITMSMGDYEKALNTASKSLEIAQSPKINNYFFTIYFEKYIADIYLIKQDFTAAKMYLEKALMLSKQFDLRYQLAELYISYGKYMEEFMRFKNEYNEEYVKLTAEMYSKSLLLAKTLNLKILMEKAIKARASFKVFCQLNSITL